MREFSGACGRCSDQRLGRRKLVWRRLEHVCQLERGRACERTGRGVPRRRCRHDEHHRLRDGQECRRHRLAGQWHDALPSAGRHCREHLPGSVARRRHGAVHAAQQKHHRHGPERIGHGDERGGRNESPQHWRSWQQGRLRLLRQDHRPYRHEQHRFRAADRNGKHDS